MTQNNLPANPQEDGFEITPRGARATGNPTYAQWDSIFNAWRQIGLSVPWIVGSLAAYGEARWGEMYAQAMDATGLGYYTLAGYKRVHLAIPYEEREDPSVVPWTYYKIIAHLSPRQRLAYIARVKSGDIETTRMLQAELKLNGEERPALPTPTTPPCPVCGEMLDYTRAERDGKCKACGAGVLEMAWKYQKLHTAIIANQTEKNNMDA